MLATYSMLSEYWTHLTDHDLKLLNKNLIADILLNGFTTENIKIDQSTKLCMDPLIRKVNGDKGIEALNIGGIIGLKVSVQNILNYHCGHSSLYTHFCRMDVTILSTFLRPILTVASVKNTEIKV